MEMPDLHRRILDASRDTCDRYGLALAGGYAMRAHQLVDRPSQDLDFAGLTSTPLAEIVDAMSDGYRASGLEVEEVRGTYLLARVIVTDPSTKQSCPVDLMKVPLQRPPVMLEVGPVANLDDLVGMKVGALHGRGVVRDVIDVSAVAGRYSFAEL